MWWQNLNDRPGDRWDATGSPFWAGRASIGGERLRLGWEWSFKSTFCQLKFEADGDERGLTWAFAFPPIALWFHLQGRWVQWLLRLLRVDYDSNCSKNGGDIYGMSRELGISIAYWTIRLDVWSKADCWSRDDPWWMRWSFDIPEFFLGRSSSTDELLEKRAVKIPMPEATYGATVEFKRVTWGRPRWFKKVFTRADFDVPGGIPIPGKGTMSYNCGPDLTGSLSGPADSIEDGIGMVIVNALETRKKRGAPPDYNERAA